MTGLGGVAPRPDSLRSVAPSWLPSVIKSQLADIPESPGKLGFFPINLNAGGNIAKFVTPTLSMPPPPLKEFPWATKQAKPDVGNPAARRAGQNTLSGNQDLEKALLGQNRDLFLEIKNVKERLEVTTAPKASPSPPTTPPASKSPPSVNPVSSRLPDSQRSKSLPPLPTKTLTPSSPRTALEKSAPEQSQQKRVAPYKPLPLTPAQKTSLAALTPAQKEALAKGENVLKEIYSTEVTFLNKTEEFMKWCTSTLDEKNISSSDRKLFKNYIKICKNVIAIDTKFVKELQAALEGSDPATKFVRMGAVLATSRNFKPLMLQQEKGARLLEKFNKSEYNKNLKENPIIFVQRPVRYQLLNKEVLKLKESMTPEMVAHFTRAQTQIETQVDLINTSSFLRRFRRWTI